MPTVKEVIKEITNPHRRNDLEARRRKLGLSRVALGRIRKRMHTLASDRPMSDEEWRRGPDEASRGGSASRPPSVDRRWARPHLKQVVLGMVLDGDDRPFRDRRDRNPLARQGLSVSWR